MSSVAQKCNLLSQYVKENGRFAIKGVETMNLLPNLVSNSKNDAMLEQESSPITIFYAGQVFVFSNFSAEKAKEIMALAAKAASSKSNVTPDLNVASTSGSNNNIVTPGCFHQRSQAVPIARRASLRRFFEKRKDRVTAGAPYQVNSPASMAAVAAAAFPRKQEVPSKYSWMESSSEKLDLNL